MPHPLCFENQDLNIESQSMQIMSNGCRVFQKYPALLSLYNHLPLDGNPETGPLFEQPYILFTYGCFVPHLVEITF
jgi:hypothetical protein